MANSESNVWCGESTEGHEMDVCALASAIFWGVFVCVCIYTHTHGVGSCFVTVGFTI
jgi:uncharacterized membrane protein